LVERHFVGQFCFVLLQLGNPQGSAIFDTNDVGQCLGPLILMSLWAGVARQQRPVAALFFVLASTFFGFTLDPGLLLAALQGA